MSVYSNAINLAGLIADIAGFSILSWEFLKRPDGRRFWGGRYKADLAGLSLVTGGFVLQALAQIISFFDFG